MNSARDTAESLLSLEAQSSPKVTCKTVLEMRGIVKKYGATIALDNVDFTLCEGEIHALLGENGAGKSTLMQILAGTNLPDAGTISLRSQPLRITSPRIARKNGIAMVHQHFSLVPAFSVAENLALDAPTSNLCNFSPQRSAQKALQTAQKLGWNLDPNRRVSELSVGEQQRIEIVKALATGANLVIFDEPTAVLGADEVEELFKVFQKLRDAGKSVILIAHKLSEIVAVADRVTVLRKGKKVGSVAVADTNIRELAQMMVGSVAEPLPTREGTTSQDQRMVHLKAEQLVVYGDRGERAIDGLNLGVAAGEIFGIGGVDGNGQVELAEALMGLRPLASGEICWKSGTFQPGTIPTAGYIPQDRRRFGLATSMTIEENLLFGAVKERTYQSGFLLNWRALRGLAKELIQRFDIRTPSPNLPVSALSGGNQQKIVAARAFRNEPELIVAVNPTRGLDISATRFVHQNLLSARQRGACVVLISTDLDEIAALADTAAILSGGKLSPYDLETTQAADVGLLLGGIQAV